MQVIGESKNQKTKISLTTDTPNNKGKIQSKIAGYEDEQKNKVKKSQ